MPIVYPCGIGQDQSLDARGEDCGAKAGADQCQSLFFFFLSRQSESGAPVLVGGITYAVHSAHAPQHPHHSACVRVRRVRVCVYICIG